MAAPTDIVVRRCTVRVVRHGGWSWGPQPQRLADQVLAALPGLIAERLADLAPDGISEDMEITEPVRIAVSLPQADLLSGRFGGLERVAVAMEPHLEPFPASGTARPQAPTALPQAPTRLHQTPFAQRAPHQDARTQPMTLAEFIGRIYERGELGQFLALLPVGTLEAWYQSLTVPPAERPGTHLEAGPFPPWPGDRLADGTSDPADHVPGRSAIAAIPETGRSRQLRDAIRAIAARVSHGSTSGWGATDDPAAGFPDRSVPAAASSAGPQPHGAAATTGVAQPPGTSARALAGSQPPGTSAAATTARPPATAPAPSAGPQPPGTAAVPSALTAAGTVSAGRATSTNPVTMTSGAAGPVYAAPVPVATGVADVACALPFLLLGPLSQTGYLSALGPALQAVGLQAQTAVFATALAYTVLGPLKRAWRRRPEDLAVAAAFAGLATPVPGQALTEFARVAAPALPALDAVVTRALAEGHTAGEPLVLAAVGERADGGLLLLDREGLFPVAWADAVAGLVPAWQMFGSPPVLVALTAVGALRDLADAGASFVVATAPARAEHWHRLLPHRLWTNSDDPALVRHASGYQQAVDLATEFTQAVVSDRAAVPLAASPALGRSLLLAAGLGLGTLAWILWREREPTDPLLPLERFADLSARVSFEPDRVGVRLPLGARHSDLSVHGLLADVPDVPWLGDRVVEFSGG
jgi:hypothetical protein